MVGRFGEVVLMDWGVAKIMPHSAMPTNPRFQTRDGDCVGTPAYMSPEQASGNVSGTDHRSDIYSATVLLHELLSVHHYLSEFKTVQQVMIAILSEHFSYMRLVFMRHPKHPVPPAELLHYIVRGLAKEPADRFQSVDEMIDELSAIREGRCRVSCPATLAKRMTSGVGGFIGRHPKLSPFVFYSVLLFFICYVALTARLLLHHGV